LRWNEEEDKNVSESSQRLKIANALLLSVAIIVGYLYGLFILAAIYITSMQSINKNQRENQANIDSLIENDQV
jgi:uncharacterized protein YqhQ